MIGMVIIVYFLLVGSACYVAGMNDGKQQLNGKEKDEAIKLQELKINEICGIKD